MHLVHVLLQVLPLLEFFTAVDPVTLQLLLLVRHLVTEGEIGILKQMVGDIRVQNEQNYIFHF